MYHPCEREQSGLTRAAQFLPRLPYFVDNERASRDLEPVLPRVLVDSFSGESEGTGGLQNKGELLESLNASLDQSCVVSLDVG